MGGIFGFFDYSKPGKGVEKNAPPKKPLVLFFEIYFAKFWKLIQLNFLFLLCCLPVITIVPAWTAMIKVTTHYALERPVFLYADFFSAFRKNFKKSLLSGMLLFGIVMVQTISIQIYWQATGNSLFFYLPMMIVISLLLVILFSFAYLSVMIPLLDLPLKPMIQNALRLTVLGVKRNFILEIVTFLLVGLTVGFFPISLLWILVLFFSTMALIVSFLCYPEIEKRIITPYYEKTKEERPDALYHALGAQENEEESSDEVTAP